MKKNNSKIDDFLSNKNKKKQFNFYPKFTQSESYHHLKKHLTKKYMFWTKPKF